MKVIGFIPAKGHSNRLKEKNIYPLLGKPLIHWTLEAAKKSKYLNDIFVSTDSDKVKDCISEFDINIIDRPKELSKDKTQSSLIVQNF